MAETWQTIEQAAVTLRLSVRTINRHMAAGKLQSRLNVDGRREVLVTLSDTPVSETPMSDIPPTAEPEVAPAGSIDPERVLALADHATQKADMAVTAYQTLARLAETQVRQTRRHARFAWAAVAVMAAGITVAVGWTTHRLTQTASERDHLRGEVVAANQQTRELSDRSNVQLSQAAATERSLRSDLAVARESAARAEGQLAAYREKDADRQTHEALTTSAIAEPPSMEDMISAINASFRFGKELYKATPTTNPTSRPSETSSASTDTRE